jgi:hypothetical protein
MCREREKEDSCTVGERERDSNHNCLGSTYSFDSLVDFFFYSGDMAQVLCRVIVVYLQYFYSSTHACIEYRYYCPVHETPVCVCVCTMYMSACVRARACERVRASVSVRGCVSVRVGD